MSATEAPPQPAEELAEGAALASPAGPVGEDVAIRMPPARSLPRLLQTLEFGLRPLSASLGARRAHGDVWMVQLLSRHEPFAVTAHPDHVESLFKARPQDAPSLTGESPLRPILGPSSVLTTVGEQHMRQRKLLLPAFHGEAVQRYMTMIEAIARRELDSWPVGREFALAPRMQAVTLDVIMSGIFGIEGTPRPGTLEHRIRQTVRWLLLASTNIAFELVELQNIGRAEPRGILKWAMGLLDRQLYRLIRERRAAGDDPEGHDVFSLLLRSRDEQGRKLTDGELRDQIVSLVLAGHETTANSLAWTFERLLRSPAAHDRLRELVRGGEKDGDAYVEATIYEGMRRRPVIPLIVRMVKRRWRLGDYVVPAGTPVAVSIVALHHREDVYPEPFAFTPERFLDRRQPQDLGTGRATEAGGLAVRKPGTYTWIPFGGGIRRCLGASLAMAEQRVVLREIARRVDLRAPRSVSERPRQRNVTMIPSRGGRVIVERKL